MIMQPAVHIVLAVDEESVRLFFATVAFWTFCWAFVRLTEIYRSGK